MARNLTVYLIADLNGEVRVVKKRPRLHPSEVAVQIDLSLPTPPKIAAHLSIDLPEPPEANVDATVAEWGPADPDPNEDTP